ncbi:MAG: hypothetical protein WCG75_00395, partial [Armatimonadota bacterium]
MRVAALCLVFGVAAVGNAQFASFNAMASAIYNTGQIKVKQELSGEKQPPKTTPLPAQPNDEHQLEIIHAGSFGGSGDELELTDGV